jgi:hypothetical protein
MQITFYVQESDDEVEPIATGQTMTECAHSLIPDYCVEFGRIRAFREIVADNAISDMPVISLDEGTLDIRDGWLFFIPQYAIPTNTDFYDN